MGVGVGVKCLPSIGKNEQIQRSMKVFFNLEQHSCSCLVSMCVYVQAHGCKREQYRVRM